MVTGIGLGEHREAIGVVLPWELATIDDAAADRGAMATQVFGQRVHHDIGTVVDRAQQDRCCYRVVDHQRDAISVRQLGQGPNIGDVARRVADTLAVDTLRGAVDHRFDVFRLVTLGEARIDLHAGQQVVEQGVGGAIELRHGDEVAVGLAQVEDRIHHRRLAGGHRQGTDTTFEHGHAPVEDIDRGIAQPRVTVTRPAPGLLEEVDGVFRTVELIGGGLVDRHRHCLGSRIAVVATVDRYCFGAHWLHSSSDSFLFVSFTCWRRSPTSLRSSQTRRMIVMSRSLPSSLISCSSRTTVSSFIANLPFYGRANRQQPREIGETISESAVT